MVTYPLGAEFDKFDLSKHDSALEHLIGRFMRMRSDVESSAIVSGIQCSSRTREGVNPGLSDDRLHCK
jgi:hypothetical protein